MIPPSEADAFVRAMGLSYAPEARKPRPEISAPAHERRRATRMTIFGVALVLVLHVWIISAGLVTYWPRWSSYYSNLADAFRSGQTSLLIQPDPRQLALSDPYNPRDNVRFRQIYGIHDLVLFEGRFYEYWGPVPALLLVPVQWLDGGREIGDQYLVFLFMAGTVIVTGVMMRWLWGRFFPDQPTWTLFVGIVVAGLATPMSYFLARSAVYEAAIIGGQFFLLTGICLLLCRKRRKTEPTADDETDADLEAREAQMNQLGIVRLTLIGVCWALAVGSRVSLAIAVTALALLVSGRVLSGGWDARRRIEWRRLLAFGTPLVFAAAGLAAYNQVRFGSITEFGQRYQLTGGNYHSMSSLFSMDHLPPSLYSYALRPLHWGLRFPFLEAAPGNNTFPSWIGLPQGYEYNEPIAGVLGVTPFLWLIAIPVIGLLFNTARALRRRPNPLFAPLDQRTFPDDEAIQLDRVVVYLLLAAVLGFVPVLFSIGSTMRYLVDLTPCLMPIAVLGMWKYGRRVANRRPLRRMFHGFILVVSGYSVAAGLLLGLVGYNFHFQKYHPEWFVSATRPSESSSH